MTRLHLIRTRWAAVGAALAISLGAVGLGGLNIASADVSSGDRPVFIPIAPCRLLDTRAASPVGPRATPLGAGETYTVTAHGDNGRCTGASTIPVDAVALATNVTSVRATAVTFLTFWGEGANPGTSNLNPRPNAAPTPNSVNTPLSTAGTFNIYNDAGTVDVLVDVNGYYALHDHDDRYELKPTQLVIDGLAFRPQSSTSNWTFDDVWEHSPSAPFQCLVADVDLPIGVTLEGAELHYQAPAPTAFNLVVGQRASGAESNAGPAPSNLVQFVLPLPATPPNEFGVQTMAVNTSLSTAPGYSQTVSICTAQDLTIGSVRLTHPPA
ncbi:MAG: hypothetical protein ABJ314_11575 [Ilumatobacter sp.]|uniref:hypothetical protein n=1 Tax=Ilumatobacter sp. TaxID=1967498 RepID=UPI003297C170